MNLQQYHPTLPLLQVNELLNQEDHIIQLLILQN
jgi:hypothetical protein